MTSNSSNFSRRSFLKAIGAASVGSVASTIALPQTSVYAAPALDNSLEKKALKIAQESEEIKNILSQLRAEGIRLNLRLGRFQQDPAAPLLVALIPKHLNFSASGTAAILVITIDLSRNIVSGTDLSILSAPSEDNSIRVRQTMTSTGVVEASSDKVLKPEVDTTDGYKLSITSTTADEGMQFVNPPGDRVTPQGAELCHNLGATWTDCYENDSGCAVSIRHCNPSTGASQFFCTWKWRVRKCYPSKVVLDNGPVYSCHIAPNGPSTTVTWQVSTPAPSPWRPC